MSRKQHRGLDGLDDPFADIAKKQKEQDNKIDAGVSSDSTVKIKSKQILKCCKINLSLETILKFTLLV